MSMIPEVKCRRCGESFSSMRSRCPNCGTRRVAQSGRTPGPTPGNVKGTAAYERAETNTKWQMIFGLILVIAVILAVIVMVSTSLSDADAQGETKATPPVITNSLPSMEVPPTAPPTPTPNVEKVEIVFGNRVMETDFLMHLGDEPLTFQAMVYPLTIQGLKVEWTCSDETVLEIEPNEDGSQCTVNIVGTIAGGVRLTASCAGVEKTLIAYCVE